MIIFYWLLAFLVIYRIAYAISSEEGPFSVYSNIRGRVGQATWVGRGILCILCLSFNLAIVAPFLIGFASWREFVLYWLGTAGAVLLAQRWLNKP